MTVAAEPPLFRRRATQSSCPASLILSNSGLGVPGSTLAVRWASPNHPEGLTASSFFKTVITEVMGGSCGPAFESRLQYGSHDRRVAAVFAVLGQQIYPSYGFPGPYEFPGPDLLLHDLLRILRRKWREHNYSCYRRRRHKHRRHKHRRLNDVPTGHDRYIPNCGLCEPKHPATIYGDYDRRAKCHYPVECA
jgi:hypothetical protein